jgi:quercetin dioxygenase-like cupin family protein
VAKAKRTNYDVSLNNKMKKENIGTIKPDKSLLSEKRNYFVGKVILHDISKVIGAKDQKVYYAGFRNGARTKVHHHEGGQILLVTEGKGVLVLYKRSNIKGEKIRITPITKSLLKIGDMVYIPKCTLHWHGAISKNNFSHIAFNSFISGKESRTIWYDSDYVSFAIMIK